MPNGIQSSYGSSTVSTLPSSPLGLYSSLIHHLYFYILFICLSTNLFLDSLFLFHCSSTFLIKIIIIIYYILHILYYYCNYIYNCINISIYIEIYEYIEDSLFHVGLALVESTLSHVSALVHSRVIESFVHVIVFIGLSILNIFAHHFIF